MPTENGDQNRNQRCFEGGNVSADAERARELARFEGVPSEWWRAPSYVFQVLRRRKELDQELRHREEEAERTRQRVEDAVARVALKEEGAAGTNETDDKLLDLEAERRRVEREERSLREELANLQAQVERVRVKLQRVEIEIRSASSALEGRRSSEGDTL